MPVPTALKAIPRWLLWQRITKPDGYVIKVPMDRTGSYPASAHSTSTWMTFDDAVRHRKGLGLGLAMSASDDLACVDLDGCVEPETDTVAAWAQEVLERFAGAYIEFSPSGKGLHIFALGAPAGLHHSKAMDERVTDKDPFLDVFSEGQFITITGKLYSGTDNVPSLPDAWAWLQDRFDLHAQPRAAKADVDDVDIEEVADALRYFSSDDVGGRSGFIGIALALKDAFGDEAFDTWADWMTRSEHDEGEAANRAIWDSLPDQSEHISLASIFWRARKAGWKGDLPDFDEEVERQQAAPIVDNSERRRLAPIKGNRQ
jgi:hypothetical protein